MNASAECRAAAPPDAGGEPALPDDRAGAAPRRGAGGPPMGARGPAERAWPLVAVTGLFFLFVVETLLLAALVSDTSSVAAAFPGVSSGHRVAAVALAVLLVGFGLAVAAIRRIVQVSYADRRARRQAEATLRARDEFLGLTAHELKTPLTALYLELGAALRHAERRGDATGRRLLARADRAARRLGDVVTRVLAEARDEAEAPAAEEVELGDVVRRAVDARRDLFRRACCEVSVHAVGPVTGRWDRQRLERALSSLLSNAAKYGHGHPIEVEVGVDDGGARLSVRDHGIGIPPERRASIFERYERAVSSRHYGGLGLGLWITRRDTAAMGGSVTVDSRPGEGSVFTISLPAAIARHGRRPPPAGARSGRMRLGLRWLARRGRGC